jgi:DNA-binding response OmpR family regulator
MTEATQPTLLLAEGNSALRDLLVLALTQAGWQVICAADGIEALELALRCRPQAVLLDILLPRVNGLDVLRVLKKQAGFELLPIMVMSELAFRETVEQAIGAGAQAFIVKPFAVQEVVDKVRLTVEQPVRRPGQAPARPERAAQVRPYRPPIYRKAIPDQSTTG